MKISVITASYNYAQYIEEAIQSVINQTHQDWELIIVDDGSCDNSVEIIKSYCQKDARIKLLQHENCENKGLKETLLLGLKSATGDWIAFLESDDILDNDNLSKKVEIIKKHNNVKLVFNKVDFLTDNLDLKGKTKLNFDKKQKNLAKMSFPRNMFYDFYINNQILTFSCVMVETETLKNMDFDTPIDSLLDWWLWIHLAYKNEFYYIDEILTYWRLHPESYINKSKKPLLYSAQVLAYKNIYETNPKSTKMTLFLFYSNIKLLFVKTYRFLTKPFTN